MEIVLEIFIEVFLELVLQSAGWALGKTWEGRWGRRIIVGAVLLGAAMGGGFAWGRHVASTGQDALPRAVWVSLALAGATAVIAVFMRRRSVTYGMDARWAWVADTERWLWLTLTSLVAAGFVALGFETA